LLFDSAVPDVEEACKRFTELGVKFQKRPEDGWVTWLFDCPTCGWGIFDAR
jgi:hypothetical protein